jgi:transglutaminase-like putative cysteine protease
MTRRPVVDELVAVIASFVLGAATITGFSRTFEGWSFVVPLLAVSASAHSVAFFARRLGVRNWVASLLGLSMALEVVAWMRFSEALWWGLPGGDVWSRAVSQLSSAAEQVGEVVPFVPFDGGFGLAALLAVAVASSVTDSLLFGAAARLEAAVPWFAIFASVSVVGIERNRAAATVAFAIGTALVVLAARRLHAPNARMPLRAVLGRFSSGTAMALAAAVAAAVLAPAVPGFGQPALIERDRAGSVLTPLVDVRGRLASPDPTVLFRVEASRAAYWRIAGLAEFDGSVWGLDDEDVQNSAGALDAAPSELPFAENVQHYEIAALGGAYAPVVAAPVQLRATNRNLYYENESGTLLVDEVGLNEGDEYSIASAEILPSPSQLVDSTSAFPPTTGLLDVPDTPEITALAEIARSLVPDDGRTYSAALALQTWFREEFAYSLDAPPLAGPDAMLEFIERRTGYCEQFAGTFATMMRLLGHPARVAVGFTPGRQIGESTWEVSANHAHAWPEVWFDGIGWLLFEPTPGRGAPNADWTGVEPQQDESRPATTTTVTPPSTTPTNPVATTTTSVPVDTMAPEESSTSPVSDGSSMAGVVWLVALLVAVGSWLFAVPSIARRLAHVDGDANTERERLVRAWRRLLETHRLFGSRWPSSLTALETAEFLPIKAGLDERLAIDLAAAVTAVVYGDRRAPIDDLVRRTDRWCRAARPRLARRHRVRLALDPWFTARWLGRSTDGTAAPSQKTTSHRGRRVTEDESARTSH